MLRYAHRFGHLPRTTSISLRWPTLVDCLVLIGIGWFAWQHAGFLLRNDLYLYGDHPGQFYRLWQLATVIWPEDGALIGWSPYWHAGWPELQFYPPGFFFLGWLVWMGSFQQLSLFAVYQTLVFATFVIPAISFYLLLAWGMGDRLAGLVTAWLAMIFPFPLGGVQAVFIGMVGYQLAFGLAPLLILAGMWLFQTRRKAFAWLVAGLILGGIILLHPYQAIFPLGVLGLYAIFCGKGWQTRGFWLVLVVLLGLGLTAFWWLPLGLRHQLYVSITEGGWLDIRTHLENEFTWFNGTALLLCAALAGSFFRSKTRRSLFLAILLGGAGLLAFILLDYLLLVRPFDLVVLDPVRLIPGVTFALLVGLGLGLSELAWLTPRLLSRWGWGALGLPIMLVVLWIGYSQVVDHFNYTKWMQKWQPAPHRTPIFLQEAEAKYNLAPVWEVMAASPGRLLFTSHYGLLFDIPTTLKAVAPVLTGREIVGGTFSLRSPIQSYLWSGQIAPVLLEGKVELEDDKRLAAVAWEDMTDDFLIELARQYNIGLIATTAVDVRARGFLDASARFESVWSNELFTFYKINDYEPTWVEVNGATASLNRYERTTIDLQIADAASGATLLVKRTNYPLWQAQVDGDHQPIQTNEFGLMTLSLPPGSYNVRLNYRPGWPERLGGIVSLITMVGAFGWLLWHRRPRGSAVA